MRMSIRQGCTRTGARFNWLFSETGAIWTGEVPMRSANDNEELRGWPETNQRARGRDRTAKGAKESWPWFAHHLDAAPLPQKLGRETEVRDARADGGRRGQRGTAQGPKPSEQGLARQG